MSTTQLDVDRKTDHGQIVPATGAVTGVEVRLTYDDALTRREIIEQLRKVEKKLVEMDLPRV